MNDPHTPGLHHVTAIASDGARNKDFYTSTLGMRLVKKTVNFDMPNSYHLYYGNAQGSPGSLMTFFIWEGLPQGRSGRGQAVRAIFGVPPGTLAHWKNHLESRGVATKHEAEPGGDLLAFEDPDGLRLAVQECEGLPQCHLASTPSALELVGVTLLTGEESPTLDLLRAMGYHEVLRNGDTLRMESARPDPSCPVRGRYVEIRTAQDLPWARSGNGVIHHIAFRAADGAHQNAFLDLAMQRGLNPSAVMDRSYFRSIYFRCPAGILFEVATDEPGFAVDEPAETLGTRLCLPPFLRSRRAEIEQALPPL